MHEPISESVAPLRIMKETWLTRKPQTRALLMALAATFLLVLGAAFFWQNWWGLSSLMAADSESVFLKHEWWRAWTTMFAHGDEKHLLGNSFLFFILAFLLSAYFSYFVFPLAAFVFGGLINLTVLAGMPPTTSLIGMSGVVYWMGGVWLILYFMIERRKTLFQRALRSIGVGLALFMPAEAFDPKISYQTHLVGFLCGIIFGLGYYMWKRKEFRAAEVIETIIEDTSFDEMLLAESRERAHLEELAKKPETYV